MEQSKRFRKNKNQLPNRRRRDHADKDDAPEHHRMRGVHRKDVLQEKRVQFANL